MSSKAFNTTDLQLHGEHIILSSRGDDECRRNGSAGFGRPRSALYAPNLNIPDSKRRPFSAGNHPKSLSIQPFLTKTQNERRELMSRQSDFMNRSMSIPGATDSAILFNKLVRDPIAITKQLQKHKTNRNITDIFPSRHFISCDNLSDASSVDTVTSFGTKIKNKAQLSKKLMEDKQLDKIEGSPLKLVKSKPRRYVELERGIDFMNEPETKDANDYEAKNSLKLSIFMPNNKDENTSSGVSSSSDIQGNATSSPVAGCSGVQKFARSKRTISINWFPEVTPRNHRSNTIEEVTSKPNDHKDVKGVVSFGSENDLNKLNDYENEDDECLPESCRLYNTELSLVEEESSQDSDVSPKISTSIFDRYADYEEDHNEFKSSSQYGLDKSRVTNTLNNKPKRFSDESAEQQERKVKLFNLYNRSDTVQHGLYKNDENVHFDNKIEENDTKTENEIDRKFKELENKYRIEEKRKNDEHIKSLEIDYGFDHTAGLKRAWTSLENVVTKDDSTGLSVNLKTVNKNEKYDPLKTTGSYDVYRNSIALTPMESQRFPKDVSPPRLMIGQEENKIFEGTSPNSSRTTKLLDGIPDIIIDYANGKTQIGTVDNLHKDQANKEINNYKATGESESRSAAIVNENVEEYPDYLKSHEAKQYTSKVIEDYKREIETIDSVHVLALRGIRSENKEGNDIKNYKSPITPDINATSDLKAIEKPDSMRFNNQDTLNKDITKYIDEYKNYKLGNYKVERTPIDINIEKVDSDFDEDKHNGTIKASVPKTKKKIKKKSRDSLARTYSGNESSDFSLKKKTKIETKRLAKSAPCKKDGTNRVRFKPQKITLSRSSTTLNSKTFNDKDNEIMSWMSTKVSTSDETSSNDVNDTPTPDLIKEKSFELKNDIFPKLALHEPEQKIEPIIKEKQGIDEFISDSKDKHDRDKDLELKPNIAKEKGKPKEVSFEIDKYTPSIGDDFSLNDWVGNEIDGSELNDLIDDDHMVSNIYSVLKEIEQTGTSMTTGGGGDRVESDLSSKTVDESKSAEYRDILSYLENVENKANDEISSLSHTQPPFSLKVEELMELSKGELAHRAVAGALAAGKAGAAAARLRAALVNAANRATARIKAERLAARQKANAAAQQSAQAVTRHQKFIEQLINEKKALAERIEKLVAAVEAAEGRSARAARASAERLQLELRNQRQRLSQAHQRDKQTWLKQHTQKIKDMTIKGLEAEIHELEDKHATQRTALQREWEQKMVEEKEKHTREVRLLKESSTRHLEDELDRERLLAAERMEQKRVEWESALAAASERAGAEGRETARAARKEAEQWKISKEKELEERRRQLEEQAEEKRNSFLLEAGQMREKMNKEFDKYKEDYRKKQADLVKEREMEIRALSRRERDREIERAIESMEAEAEEGRKDMQESIRRIKVKYENDMKVLEDAEQSAMQRCKEARELLRESQELCAQHQITITQLEGKLRQADELRAQTIAELEISMRTAEMKSREEVEDIRGQLMNLQLQHKDEMHQLYAKVKVAVSKKDDALIAARRDAATLRDRCLRLEARLAI